MHHRLLLYPGDVGFHFTVLTWEICTCTGTLSFHHLVSSSLHHQMIFCAAPLILNFDLLAGKSTILRLMFRFFDTHSGNVRTATIWCFSQIMLLIFHHLARFYLLRPVVNLIIIISKLDKRPFRGETKKELMNINLVLEGSGFELIKEHIYSL